MAGLLLAPGDACILFYGGCGGCGVGGGGVVGKLVAVLQCKYALVVCKVKLSVPG